MNARGVMHGRQRGVTLMELLTAMVVVGILTAIAWPSYRAQVVRTNRSDAKVALEQARQGLERCFTRFNAYDPAATGCEMTFPFTVASGTYVISAAFATPTTFALTATPQGAQATDDPQCANFTLNELGVRAVSGTDTAERCWGR